MALNCGIVGLPNVGKSTLFNHLVGWRRALVGDEPGITRDRLYGKTEWRGRREAIAILDEIVTALARGDRVELRGFGSFSAKMRGGRVGRNPKTGATVQVAEKKIPYFRQGQKMRKRLNGKAAAAQLSRETGQHSSNL